MNLKKRTKFQKKKLINSFAIQKKAQQQSLRLKKSLKQSQKLMKKEMKSQKNLKLPVKLENHNLLNSSHTLESEKESIS